MAVVLELAVDVGGVGVGIGGECGCRCGGSVGTAAAENGAGVENAAAGATAAESSIGCATAAENVLVSAEIESLRSKVIG